MTNVAGGNWIRYVATHHHHFLWFVSLWTALVRVCDRASYMHFVSQSVWICGSNHSILFNCVRINKGYRINKPARGPCGHSNELQLCWNKVGSGNEGRIKFSYIYKFVLVRVRMFSLRGVSCATISRVWTLWRKNPLAFIKLRIQTLRGRGGWSYGVVHSSVLEVLKWRCNEFRHVAWVEEVLFYKLLNRLVCRVRICKLLLWTTEISW